MENDIFYKVLTKQAEEEYYTTKELLYSNKANIHLTPFEYKQYLSFKEETALSGNKYLKLLPLKTFNFKCLYYCLGADIKSSLDTYYELASGDTSFNDRFSKNFIESRIYSEIEGTLNVENVPTTRRRLKELLEDGLPALNLNDFIIKNMKEGIDFVNELPEFNKENLYKLYIILSKNCLSEENKLRGNEYYRYDSVEISRYHGCPNSMIDECMDSLFSFVNNVLKSSKDNNLLILLPHICHYYILYIHPYFDYNGRTARMVSYWVYLLTGLKSFPPIISEAINQTKAKYYQAIELSRDSHNDLTYFCKYLLNISLDYFICYQNLSAIEKELKNTNCNVLTETELSYLKKILICYEGKFSYIDFLKMANVEMSKQGALKILNKFVSYNILVVSSGKSKIKLFDINKDKVPYALKNFGFKSSR